jgi:prepilin-type N-terminal cleavage/methylation domain-containing protein
MSLITSFKLKPTSTKQRFNSLGFTFIEILIALSLLSGSYFVIFSTQQFLASHSLKLEVEFLEILRSSDQHELDMALMDGEDS